jgi:hypothetical protein
MVKPALVEAWAVQVLDSVTCGQPVEDSRVELKAEWGEPQRVARRIAGHANAARGDSLLWLIGVDEARETVVGVEQARFADWWKQVKKHFEEAIPSVTDVAIHYNGAVVVALQISSEAAPFLVKNPVFGSKGGGPVEFEVPWREATSIRTARRADLLRLLAPLQSLPEVEVLAASLIAQGEPERLKGGYDRSLGRSCRWQLRIELYVVPRTPSTVVFPAHTLDVLVTQPETLGTATFRPYDYHTFGSGRHLTRKKDLSVAAPGRIELWADHTQTKIEAMPGESAEVRLRLQPAGLDRSVSASVSLHRRDDWSYEMDVANTWPD